MAKFCKKYCYKQLTNVIDNCVEDGNKRYDAAAMNSAIANTTDSRRSPSECRKLCIQTSECRYFSWKQGK